MGKQAAWVLLVLVAALAFVSPAGAADADPPVPAPSEPGEGTPPSTPASPDNSASSLVLLGGQSATQTVTLWPASGETLHGTLTLAMRSKRDVAALGVSYLPAGGPAGAPAGSVQLEEGFAADIEKNHAKSIPLVFRLPAGASPQDLNGVVVIQPRAGGKADGHRFELNVSGAGSALKGVSIQPEKLSIDVVSWVPFDGPGQTSAGVQLSGPGVPALFAAGAAPPAFDLLLRSDNGDEVQATLTDLVQGSSNPAVATAEVRIGGDLGPGKYEGVAPISSLSTDAPKLSIALESGNSFVYALVVVLLGSLLGGALYLASNRSRRKALLRDQVKSLLNNYEHVREELRRDRSKAELPIWTLDQYLGKDRSNWYRVKWNAVLDFDGAVQTIWSDIHWARDEDDLDEVSKQIDELKERVVRWITVASSISVLEGVTKLTPDSRAGERWEALKTPEDTERLLEQIREIEPTDDNAAQELIARINRQARWHEALAEVWHAKTVLARDMEENPGDYRPNDEKMLENLDLAALDKAAHPESARSAEKQIDLKLILAARMRDIAETYRGPKEKLRLRRESTAMEKAALAPQLALYAARNTDGPPDQAVVEETLTESERETAESARLAQGLRGTSATDHDGNRIPPAVAAVLQRDLPWTASIALVTSAAYIPTIYSSTWGTPTDYVTAFAAGFLGKVAINWAAMPLFQSIRSGRSSKPATGEGPKPAAEEGQKETVTATPDGGPPKPVPPAATPTTPTAA